MDEDSDVEIIFESLATTNNKKTELLTFNKAHEVQYEGYCTIKTSVLQQSLIIEQDDESDRYARIQREFIVVKNMLCILGPRNTNDVILFFTDEERCKKIYDFVLRKKSECECTAPQKSVLKQLYIERFLTPLLNSVTKTQCERLKEIVKLVQHEDYNTVKTASLDDVNDVKDVKPIVNVKSEQMPLPADENTPTLENHDITSSSAAGSLPNKNLNELQSPSAKRSATRKRRSPTSYDEVDNVKDVNTEEHSIKNGCDDHDERPSQRIAYSHEFELIQGKDPLCRDSKLLIYVSSEKNSWYEFLFNGDKKIYFCGGCQKEGKVLVANFHFYEGENYVTVDDVEHSCKVLTALNSEAIEEMNSDSQLQNPQFEFGRKYGNDMEEDVKQSSVNAEATVAVPLTFVNPQKHNIAEVKECTSEVINEPEIENQNDANKENDSTVQKSIIPTITEYTSDDCDMNPSTSATPSYLPKPPKRNFTPAEIFGSCNTLYLTTTPKKRNETASTSTSKNQDDSSKATLSETQVSVTERESADEPPNTFDSCKGNSSRGVTDEIPRLQPMDANSSALPSSNAPTRPANTLPSFSNSGNAYCMPTYQNIPNPNYIYYKPFPANGTGNMVYVSRPNFYTIPMSSPTVNPGTPSINVSSPTPRASQMFYYHRDIRKMQPNLSVPSSSRFVGPRFYVSQHPIPGMTNLPHVYQNAPSSSPRSYTSMAPMTNNSCVPRFNLSSASTVPSQHLPRMPSFNNSFGGTANNNQLSTPSNSNRVLPSYSFTRNGPSNPRSVNNLSSSASANLSDSPSPAASNQNVLSNPTSANGASFSASGSASITPAPVAVNQNVSSHSPVLSDSLVQSTHNMNTAPSSSTNNDPSTPSTSKQNTSADEMMVNETMIKSENFTLRPDSKGVADMKLELNMPSGQTYSFTFNKHQNTYSCDKCKRASGKTTAKLCQLPSGEMYVILDENKHICTMPYASEIVLHNGYEIVKTHGGFPTLLIFNSVNMDLGYELRLSSKNNSNKFVCKDCEKLSKYITARLCVDQDDKPCLALNTEAHECKMQNFVTNGKIIKPPGYRKIKVSNDEEEIVVFYDQIYYRKFIHDPSSNCFYCEGCRKDRRDTYIKVLQNQNGEEFLLVCGIHWCNSLLCSQF